MQMLGTDSYEYEILEECVKLIKDVPGLTCEIGLRLGGGSEIIMRALHHTHQTERVHIAIDPYGSIDYQSAEGVTGKHRYGNKMFYSAMVGLYGIAAEIDQHFLFFPMEDSEFFNRFNSGIPIYRDCKYLEQNYALVHFDGPHTSEAITNEFVFFGHRCHPGSIFVFDDIDKFPYEKLVNQFLLPQDWKLIKKGVRKAAYRKE